MMYLELAVGQFTSKGPAQSWVMVPLFKGLGVSMNIINVYVTSYSIMIIAYSLYYLYLSLGINLPWEKCDPTWANANCVDNFDHSVFKYAPCEDVHDSFKYLKCDDGKCYLNVTLNEQASSLHTCETNKSLLEFLGHHSPAYPSENYWK